MPSFTAHGKINLCLHVHDRRADGYHDITTLFCRIRLADTLLAEPAASGIALSVEGAVLGEPASNLVVRAAGLFAEASGRPVHVRFVLHKQIPAGTGLAGGSSDAAATLRALNQLHGSPFSDTELQHLGARLGSDVAFFLQDANLALATGRGERLTPLPPLPPAPVLLVVPDVAVSTADAYRELDAYRARQRVQPAAPPDITAPLDWNVVRRLAHNDFEPVVFARIPALAGARDALEEAGAHIARLTGSGSALFGVFLDDAECENAARTLQRHFPDCRVIITETS